MRIVIPIGIVTRICEQLGWISHLGDLLGTLMQLVGLPGELGLVWATTMVLNIYAGVMVFATLSTGLELNVAQMTVIGTMMLVAHALPVELRVAQKIGTRFRIMLLLRVAGAFVLGALLNQIYRLSDTLQQPATTLWRPVAQDTGWLAWGLGQFKSMLMILVIIFSLMLLLKLCRKVGITALLTRLLEPLLTLLGMGARGRAADHYRHDPGDQLRGWSADCRSGQGDPGEEGCLPLPGPDGTLSQFDRRYLDCAAVRRSSVRDPLGTDSLRPADDLPARSPAPGFAAEDF